MGGDSAHTLFMFLTPPPLPPLREPSFPSSASMRLSASSCSSARTRTTASPRRGCPTRFFPWTATATCRSVLGLVLPTQTRTHTHTPPPVKFQELR